MGQVIAIENWEKFQHYKDRDPPWIKLYRDMLTAESWVLGNDCSRLVQVAITLLSARYQNATPYNFGLIRKVSSLDCSAQEFSEAIAHLVAHKFLKLLDVEDEASSVLAKCSPETEQSRGETETEQRCTAIASPRTPRRKVSRETIPDPEWFVGLKLAYPNRAGDVRWAAGRRAINARLREGHTPEELRAGVERYAAYARATGSTGTQFVKTAPVFFGLDKPFLQRWDPPAPSTRPNGRKTFEESQRELARLAIAE